MNEQLTFIVFTCAVCAQELLTINQCQEHSQNAHEGLVVEYTTRAMEGSYDQQQRTVERRIIEGRDGERLLEHNAVHKSTNVSASDTTADGKIGYFY